MDISIIISTRDRADSLARTLAAFKKVRIPDGATAEILVVDNASTDNTRAVAQGARTGPFSLRYLLEPAPGKMHAQNRGLNSAQGTILLTTDDDVIPSHDWLVLMTGPLMKGAHDAVVGRIELAAELTRPWMTTKHKRWLAASDRTPAYQSESPDKLELIGASMGFHRRVLQRVPEFDTELGPGALGFADDTLFSWQLQEAGFRIGEEPEALVTHHPNEDRMLRRNWEAAAQKMGRSYAYLGYHWAHKTPTRAYVRFCRTYAQYHFWRTIRRRECSTNEGIPLWELTLLERLHRMRHYLALAKRPRHYEKHGLRKRAAN